MKNTPPPAHHPAVSSRATNHRMARRDWLKMAAAACPGAWLAHPAQAAAAGDPLRLMVAGQSLIKSDLRAHPYDGFSPVAELLAEADAAFTNLEVTIDAPGAGEPTKSGLYFHTAKPVVLDCLKALSFDLLSLSNNHAFDLGTGGMMATLREVRQRGFQAAGTGHNLDEAAQPAFFETPKGTVALVAMASSVNRDSIATAERPGLNHLKLASRKDGTIDEADSARILRSIQQAAEHADIVLVYQHNHYWEPDNRDTPEWQRQWAHQCVDAGASLFVNHGVPLLHGIEIYRGAPIFYCLGNLVFHTHTPPGHYSDHVWESVIADLRFGANGMESMTLHPVRLTEGIEGESFFATRGRPQLATGEQGAAILKRLAKLSEPYGTQFQFDSQGRAVL